MLVVIQINKKNVTLLSSLCVSGRTSIGDDIYNSNQSIRKKITNVGDIIDLNLSLGTTSFSFLMEEKYDINLWQLQEM